MKFFWLLYSQLSRLKHKWRWLDRILLTCLYLLTSGIIIASVVRDIARHWLFNHWAWKSEAGYCWLCRENKEHKGTEEWLLEKARERVNV